MDGTYCGSARCRFQTHDHVATIRACFLAVLLSFLPSVAQAQSVWLALKESLSRLDTATGEVFSVALPWEAKSLAATADGDVWVLGKKALRRYDGTLQLRNEFSLAGQLENYGEPSNILLNPHDRSLWVAAGETLLHLDEKGGLLASLPLAEKPRAIALDADDSLWVLAGKRLLRFSPAGALLQSADLAFLRVEPKLLAPDRRSNRLWIAGGNRLFQIDLADLTRVVREVRVPALLMEQGDESGIEALAAHPIFGTLWVGTKGALVLLDRDGAHIRNVDLAALGLRDLEALAFDPVEFGLWLGGKGLLLHLRSNGDFVARHPLAGEVKAIGVPPFKLSPVLSLIAPSDGGVTNQLHAPLRYGLGADCTGTPCTLDPDYTRSFTLRSKLNGAPLAQPFGMTPEEAVLAPAARWPEGRNRLSSQATDRFGHRSEPVEHSFTVDTIAPRFVSVSPADGASVDQGLVTISGNTDDPGATVQLIDANGVAVATAGSPFAFGVVLKDGWNAFTLIARDAAGNETTMPLRIMLSGLSTSLTEPAPGATLSADSISVAGTFSGPPNSGITVNGRVAMVDGDRFYVNNLELRPGVNVLTITVTAPDGSTRTSTVNVTSNATSALRATAEPERGAVPLKSRFNVTLSNGRTAQRIEIDADGDGAVDVTSTDPAAVAEYTYVKTGAYRARIAVVDSAGERHNTVVTVLARDIAKMDELLRGIYFGMLARLKAGNINGALSAVSGGMRAKYETVFNALKPNLATVVDQLGTLGGGMIGDEMAEYVITRSQGGQSRAFLIYFLRSEDGVWRIDGM